MRCTRHMFGFLGLVALAAGGVSLSAQRDQPQRYRPDVVPLSGTYELDTSRGDDAARAAEQATGHLRQPERERAYQNLVRRLQPPATLAIDRNGRTVTISSSSGPRATFDADGRTRDEPGPGGRPMATRAEFIGERLSVTTSGNRNTDFLVSFEPMDGAVACSSRGGWTATTSGGRSRFRATTGGSPMNRGGKSTGRRPAAADDPDRGRSPCRRGRGSSPSWIPRSAPAPHGAASGSR